MVANDGFHPFTQGCWWPGMVVKCTQWLLIVASDSQLCWFNSKALPCRLLISFLNICLYVHHIVIILCKLISCKVMLSNWNCVSLSILLADLALVPLVLCDHPVASRLPEYTQLRDTGQMTVEDAKVGTGASWEGAAWSFHVATWQTGNSKTHGFYGWKISREVSLVTLGAQHVPLQYAIAWLLACVCTYKKDAFILHFFADENRSLEKNGVESKLLML